MKSYNVKCPVCGTVNHNLNLEETEGLMECEYCHQVTKVEFVKMKMMPVLTLQQLAAYYNAAK